MDTYVIVVVVTSPKNPADLPIIDALQEIPDLEVQSLTVTAVEK